jgi:hypothetical protein
VKDGSIHKDADQRNAFLQFNPNVVRVIKVLLIRIRALAKINLVRNRGHDKPLMVRYHLREVTRTRPAKYVPRPPAGPKTNLATVASNVGMIRKPFHVHVTMKAVVHANLLIGKRETTKWM